MRNTIVIAVSSGFAVGLALNLGLRPDAPAALPYVLLGMALVVAFIVAAQSAMRR